MDDVQDVVVTAAAEAKDAGAKKLIRYYSLCSAGAGLLSPPVVDLAAVTAVQLRMVRRLAAHYGKDFDQESGRTLVAALSGALAPAFVGQGAAKLLVRLLGTGTIGALAAGGTIPALNYGTTVLVGKFFQSHFRKPGTDKANWSELSQTLASAVAR